MKPTLKSAIVDWLGILLMATGAVFILPVLWAGRIGKAVWMRTKNAQLVDTQCDIR